MAYETIQPEPKTASVPPADGGSPEIDKIVEDYATSTTQRAPQYLPKGVSFVPSPSPSQQSTPLSSPEQDAIDAGDLAERSNRTYLQEEAIREALDGDQNGPANQAFNAYQTQGILPEDPWYKKVAATLFAGAAGYGRTGEENIESLSYGIPGSQAAALAGQTAKSLGLPKPVQTLASAYGGIRGAGVKGLQAVEGAIGTEVGAEGAKLVGAPEIAGELAGGVAGLSRVGSSAVKDLFHGPIGPEARRGSVDFSVPKSHPPGEIETAPYTPKLVLDEVLPSKIASSDPIPLAVDVAYAIRNEPLELPVVPAGLEGEPVRLSGAQIANQLKRLAALKGATPPLDPGHYAFSMARSVAETQNDIYGLISRGPAAPVAGWARLLAGWYSFVNPAKETIRGILPRVGVWMAKADKKRLRDSVFSLRGKLQDSVEEYARTGRQIEKLPDRDRYLIDHIKTGRVGFDEAYEVYPIAAEYAAEASRNHLVRGESLVNLGLMTQETFNRRATIYGARYLEKYIQKTANRGFPKGNRQVNQSAQDLARMKFRQNVSQETALQEIFDGAKTITKESIEEARLEIKAQLQKFIASQDVYTKAENPGGWVEVAADEKIFGPLAGKFVHPYAAELVSLKGKDATGFFPPTIGAKPWLSLWKAGKTIFSPSTTLRQLGNFMFADMSGAPLYYGKGLRILIEEGKSVVGVLYRDEAPSLYARILKLQGLSGGSYARANAVAAKELQRLFGILDETPETEAMWVINRWSKRILDSYPAQVAGEIYQAFDDVFKTASYRYLVEVRGFSHELTKERILGFHQFYDRMPQWVRHLEKTPLMGPFLSFTFEATRILYNALQDPMALVSLAKWYGAAKLSQIAMVEAGIISRKDMEKIQDARSRGYRNAGLPSPVFETPFGRFDLNNWMPLQGPMDSLALTYGAFDDALHGSNASHGKALEELAQNLGVGSGPVTSLFVNIWLGEDPYTHRQLYGEGASQERKLSTIAAKALETLSPPLTPIVGNEWKRLAAGVEGLPIAGQRKKRDIYEELISSLTGLRFERNRPSILGEYRRLWSEEARRDAQLAVESYQKVHPGWEPPIGMFQQSQQQIDKYNLLTKLRVEILNRDGKAQVKIITELKSRGILNSDEEISDALDNLERSQAEQFFGKLPKKKLDEISQAVRDIENYQAIENLRTNPLKRKKANKER